MTKIFAHRGFKGIYPENTMIAFEHAMNSGADGIELDVQLTKDGRLAVIHDEKLNRTTNLKGLVKDHTYEELKAADASHTFFEKTGAVSIPLLEEVLELVVPKSSLLINIELKNSIFRYPGIEEKVKEQIEHFQIEDRVLVSSFHHGSLAHFHKLMPDVELAVLTMDVIHQPEVYIKTIPAKGYHPNMKGAGVTKEVVTALQSTHQAIRPFTVNSEKQMKKMFSLGVDGIFTDFPDRAVKIRDEMK
ncbi:glycerophosphodiester phosphodiesterase [Bacillus sp. NPDC093026]|uniref:glycerophosphodiester phosphodiesterase n=1 Tax=Bacillus sp. NPDC093026 TaxID=3363948 RepID=UPI003807C18C